MLWCKIIGIIPECSLIKGIDYLKNGLITREYADNMILAKAAFSIIFLAGVTHPVHLFFILDYPLEPVFALEVRKYRLEIT